MTADEQSQAKPREPPAYVSDVHSAPDPVLLALVRLVNDYDMDMSLTLHVCGLTVSGTAISGGRFFEQMAETMTQDGPYEGQNEIARRGLADAFTSFAQSHRTAAEHARSEARTEQRSLSPPTYIHLENASVWPPGADPLPATLWRGRLSHVSGWSLGAFASSPPER